MEEVEGGKRETIKRPIEYARVGGVLLTNTHAEELRKAENEGEGEGEQSTNCDDENY